MHYLNAGQKDPDTAKNLESQDGPRTRKTSGSLMRGLSCAVWNEMVLSSSMTATMCCKQISGISRMSTIPASVCATRTTIDLTFAGPISCFLKILSIASSGAWMGEPTDHFLRLFRRYSSEDERFFHVLDVARPGPDAGGLLSRVIEQPSHLLRSKSGNAARGGGQAENFGNGVCALVAIEATIVASPPVPPARA
jgi:hypothetical protein